MLQHLSTNMPITYDGTQYSGIWTMQQVNSAIAAGTWPVVGPKLYAWGLNSAGQLGLNNTVYSYSSPKQVGSLANWSVVSGFQSSSFAVKTDGTLWSWGTNSSGQLGLGDTVNRSSPAQVGTLTTWSKISSGQNFCLAVKTDGTLWSWGANAYGALGLGNTTNYSSPKQIGALTTWDQIAGGGQYSLAIKTDGTLWSWGGSVFQVGQLGLGNLTNYSSPKQVGALTNWSKISANNYHSLAVKTDGTLWSWGGGPFTNYGQLGLGNTTNYSSPKQIGALTAWSSVKTEAGSSIALKTDGTIWSWGLNQYGQLGLGNTTNYSSPKQIGALTNWLSIVGGGYFTAATKTDGTLWAWGQNTDGELGLGNVTGYSSPKQVGSLTNWSKLGSGFYYLLAITAS